MVRFAVVRLVARRVAGLRAVVLAVARLAPRRVVVGFAERTAGTDLLRCTANFAPCQLGDGLLKSGESIFQLLNRQGLDQTWTALMRWVPPSFTRLRAVFDARLTVRLTVLFSPTALPDLAMGASLSYRCGMFDSCDWWHDLSNQAHSMSGSGYVKYGLNSAVKVSKSIEQTAITYRSDRLNQSGRKVEIADMQRVIKKYANRKLYDMQERRYVTLTLVRAMVEAGDNVRRDRPGFANRHQ